MVSRVKDHNDISHKEKVVTHTETDTYNHGMQVDVSPASIKYKTGPSNTITRIKLSKNYEFGDELTAQDFNAKYEAFQDRLRDVILIQKNVIWHINY